jgi:hypothetical protein
MQGRVILCAVNTAPVVCMPVSLLCGPAVVACSPCVSQQSLGTFPSEVSATISGTDLW